MSDETAQLQKRLYRGESAAFISLYDLLGERIFRYLVAQSGSAVDAADIVQETFVAFVKFHRKLGKAKNLTGYAFAIARNEMIRFKKKQSRMPDLDPEVAEAIPVIDASELTFESNDWIQSVLIRLDDIDQEIVRLKVFAELNFDEVATATKLNPNNVATRYRRAILKLESLLDTENIEPTK